LCEHSSIDNLNIFITDRTQAHDGENYRENPKIAVDRAFQLYIGAFVSAIQLLLHHPLIDDAGKKLGQEARDKLRALDILENPQDCFVAATYPLNPHETKPINTTNLLKVKRKLKDSLTAVRKTAQDAFAFLNSEASAAASADRSSTLFDDDDLSELLPE
jgi:hypothetical protein